MKKLMNELAGLFELHRGGSGENIAAMEGLRGVAVALVFLVHYHSFLIGKFTDPLLNAWAGFLYEVGNSGVDIFFVLSGYLIYRSVIRKPIDPVRYARRRAQRLYPAFLPVFVLYIGLSFVFPKESRLPEGMSAQIQYLLANLFFLPGIFHIEPLITVAWSLSYEVLYYVVMPLAVSALMFRCQTGMQRFRAVFLLAVFSLAGFALWGGPVRLVLFMAGILLYEALELRPKVTATVVSSLTGATFLSLGICAFTIGDRQPLGGALQTLVSSVSFFMAIYIAFASPDSGFARAFSYKYLRWLGNMSYSYYLIHGLSLKAVFLILGKLHLLPDTVGMPFYLGLLIVCFTVSLVPAAVLYIVFERPLSLLPALRNSRKS